MTAIAKSFLLVPFVSLLLFSPFAGCGNDKAQRDTYSEQLVETGHEGHNHGPDEHEEIFTSASADDGELDWCAEHAVPESQCTACHPELIAEFKETGDWCAGHGLPESHCRLCNPGISFPQEKILKTLNMEQSKSEIEISLYLRSNSTACATDGALIQFASATTADRVGISVRAVRTSSYESAIDAPAEVVFDESEASVVTSTVPALVSRWLISPGDVVQKGEVLAVLQSPEIAQLKSSLVSALAAYEVERKELVRHQELKDRNLISEADFDRQEALTEQAQAGLTSARGLLISAGLSEGDIDEVIGHAIVSNKFALRAPASGMVVERIAQLGELLDAGRAYAILAEPKAMWIEASLTEEQVRHVSVGQHLTFNSDGRALNRVGGEIIWISRFLDPHTRNATVRARVIDPNHQLQASEFGRVKIVRQDPDEVLLVPKDAVQWEGCCNVVFVKEAVDRYRPRKVKLLQSSGPYYQITGGVKPGEEVVVNGAFLLKTELKKSSIGAGCCGLEPVG